MFGKLRVATRLRLRGCSDEDEELLMFSRLRSLLVHGFQAALTRMRNYKMFSGLRGASIVPRVTPTRLAALSIRHTWPPPVRPAIRSW